MSDENNTFVYLLFVSVPDKEFQKIWFFSVWKSHPQNLSQRKEEEKHIPVFVGNIKNKVSRSHFGLFGKVKLNFFHLLSLLPRMSFLFSSQITLSTDIYLLAYFHILSYLIYLP